MSREKHRKKKSQQRRAAQAAASPDTPETQGAVATEDAGREAEPQAGKTKKPRRKGPHFKRPVRRTHVLIAVAILIAVALSLRSLVAVWLENRSLKAENTALKAEKKELELELENVSSREYIEEQARQQLRLADPDEILFVFPDDDEDSTDSDEKD